jgi:hypothetical protein
MHPMDMAYLRAAELTSFQNGTSSIEKTDEPFDIMPILVDWAHGRNLPSLKSVFVGLATAVHIILDFFVNLPSIWAHEYWLTFQTARLLLVEDCIHTRGCGSTTNHCARTVDRQEERR